ncbi:LCP family protein [Streptomyces sp. SKN60]|uniref:LCP family protein n=1 Tax=Streptomyces sp. SKN60 TaxID=2855506 RepID=UPI002245692A|nr:LCP family protein [Streptomyces sp. SKN60]MCX2185579.1 LCP family protein [Streptomyces sp. SKN60]
MGQSSVRREGARDRASRAQEVGWDDSLYEEGNAGDGGPGGGPGGRIPRARRAGGGDDDGSTGTSTGSGSGSGTGHRRGGSRRRAKTKKSGKRKVLRWTAITLALLIIGTAGAGYLYYEHLNGNIRSGGRAGGESGVKKAAPNALGDTPLNILLIGSDNRNDPKNVALGGGKKDRDRPALADVQMLLHVSADRKNASIISIPRDTVVKIPECTGEDGQKYPETDNRPINESLQRGGPGCTLTTWEKLTGVYIDHWMMIEFWGVVAMADEVGGVPVCVKTGVYDKSTLAAPGGSGLKLPAGTHPIQGEQALQWLRTRHAWGSDQGRAQAQHMYMNGLMKKLQDQDAWTDTPRLMGLAETATKAFKVSDEIKTVKKLFDLSMQLKNVKLDRLTTATVPTTEYPPNPKAWLQPVPSAAEKMWSMLRDDVAMDKNGDPADGKGKPKASASAKPAATAGAPGSLAVTVINGTAGDGEPAQEGRATDVAKELRDKGFGRSQSSRDAQPRKDSVVFYPKGDGEQGKADATSVATALGLPASAVRADAKVSGLTLVVGADWREGRTYKKPTVAAGDLPEGADDKTDCMDVYSVYKWDGKS